MAIIVTELTSISEFDFANNTTFNTNTLTATANKLYLLFITSGYSTPRTLSSVSGGGLGTWTIISGCSQENAAQTRRSEVAYAWSASPGAGAAIDITYSGATIGCAWALYEITGFNTSTPIGQSGKATGTATTGAPTLASASSGSVILAALMHVSNEATTAEAVWTAGVNLKGSGPTISMLSASRLLVDDLSCTFTWTTSGIFVSSIVEITPAAEAASSALTPTVEFYNGAAWVDITADVIYGTLKWSGGIQGSRPTDRVAAPGNCDFELRNGTNSSGGVMGYYSPDHVNKRADWALKVKIRLTLTDGTSTRYWQYRVNSLTPIPGQYGPRRVEVNCLDYMKEFADRKVSGLDIQIDKTGDMLLGTLVDGMPFAPGYENYATGAFAIPYAFHAERDEETTCLTVLQKISQSELSYIYQDGSATQARAETLTYEPHITRFGSAAAAASLNNAMDDLEIDHSTDNIFNKVRGTSYPVEIDTVLSALGWITAEFTLEPGETRTVFIPYRDASSERRISGTLDLTNYPITADTDYKMSSVAENGGTDLNANLSVTPTAGANSIMAVLTNSAAVKGYVNLLQVRGYAVRVFDKVESLVTDSTSITAYGEKTLTFNMPYQNNAAFGVAVATEILRRYKDPNTQISSVVFLTKNATLITYALTVGIGSRVTITETVTGVTDAFYINGFDYEMPFKNILRVTWILERAFNDTPYFTIDHITYGAIDGTYTLAPF